MSAINVRALLGLPDLERAEEMSRLLQLHNWEQKTLAKHMGLSVDKVSRYLMPIKLCKELKDAVRLMPVDKRPPLGSVELLCRLESHLQQEFAKALPLDLSEKKQILWLKGEFAASDIDLSRGKFRRKYRLGDVPRLTLRLAAVSRKVASFASALEAMTQDGRKVALATTEYPQRRKSLQKNVRALVRGLQAFDALLEFDVSPDKSKLPTEVSIEKLASKRIPRARIPEPPKPPPQPKPEVVIKKLKAKIVNPRSVALPVPRSKTLIEVEYKTKKFHDLTVTRWDENALRYVLDKVTPRQYVELTQQGMLKYQRTNLQRPDFLPDPVEVAEELGITFEAAL